MMGLISRLTQYVIREGGVQRELTKAYEYSFQILLEMGCCLIVSTIIAVYLGMIPEFIVSTIVFMILRSYAGGVHLPNYISCFVCSIIVQTAILVFCNVSKMSNICSLSLILICSILIIGISPVDNKNRKLNKKEKCHCKKCTILILSVIIAISIICMSVGLKNILSVIAITVVVVMFSQYIGTIMQKFGKREEKG